MPNQFCALQRTQSATSRPPPCTTNDPTRPPLFSHNGGPTSIPPPYLPQRVAQPASSLPPSCSTSDPASPPPLVSQQAAPLLSPPNSHQLLPSSIRCPIFVPLAHQIPSPSLPVPVPPREGPPDNDSLRYGERTPTQCSSARRLLHFWRLLLIFAHVGVAHFFELNRVWKVLASMYFYLSSFPPSVYSFFSCLFSSVNSPWSFSYYFLFPLQFVQCAQKAARRSGQPLQPVERRLCVGVWPRSFLRGRERRG